ncbi:unnamed protein product [Moneuplotes crassus]|uniref:Uncharacterized protein n=1 Tax=Euplotes crassus TaxID=5936 RepID=A0AAD1UIY7_EUPCR|nr:unnamed protein product [Moneuplotes crassus]
MSAMTALFLYFTTLLDQPRSYEHKGNIEPSDIEIERIYKENKNINSLLKSLMTTKFFRNFRTNPSRKCEFSISNQKCKNGQCPVYEDEAMNVTTIRTYIVNRTLDPKMQEFTSHIPVEEYTDQSDGWTVDEHLEKEGLYIDLQKNPERYTGFNDTKIWNEIESQSLNKLNFTTSGPHRDLLPRVISGIHTSSDMHISQFFLEDISVRESFTTVDFTANYEQFHERVGKYPDKIKDLFYTSLLFIDALSHIRENLPHYIYYSDDESKNMRIQNRMQWFSHYVSKVADPDKIQSGLFKKVTKEELIQSVKPAFRSVSELVNCIECDVCKLNTRVQFVGVAAMFKILLTEKDKEVILSENELVAFINTIFRLSNSIKFYKEALDHEASEAFIKMMMYIIILSFAGLFFFLAIIAFCCSSPPKKDEERVPLRMQDAIAAEVISRQL